MSVVMLKDIVLAYGERALFDEISVDFQEDQKVGIVGRNGAGKSTLLKVIAGQQKVDSGTVTLNKQMRIAYLPQEVVLQSTKTIFDEVFSVFDTYLILEKEQADIEEKLTMSPDNADELLERYQHILDVLSQFDRPNAEQRTVMVLQGLGLAASRLQERVDTLSVGWKMRLVLAKLLLQQADFYLFDEPTNHLDIVAQEWFLDFLRNAPFGYLLVTHDRHFLDKGCDWTFELSRGHGTMYRGNYTAYLRTYEERRARTEAAAQLQQKEIEQKKRTIERFKASASKASMAQSMLKQLNKIEIIEVEPPEPTIRLSFPPIERAGNVVMTAENLSYSYGPKKLFDHANCEVKRGHKVALIAPNGVGKSTLFDLIAGKLALQTGRVDFGHNVHFALFEQDQTKVLDPESSILDELTHACPKATNPTIRAFLGSFLFSGDDVHKKIEMLSGGEKNRVAMVKVFLQNANFLLLDEPTNHLDLYAKSVLLQALQQYPGTILFVSHDHQFIQGLATDILELTPQGLHYYPGTYEEFLADKKQKEQALAGTKPAVAAKKEKEATRENDAKKSSPHKDQQKEIRAVEQRIAKLEQKIAQVTSILEKHAYHEEPYQKALKDLAAFKAELESATAEWEKVAG